MVRFSTPKGLGAAQVTEMPQGPLLPSHSLSLLPVVKELKSGLFPSDQGHTEGAASLSGDRAQGRLLRLYRQSSWHLESRLGGRTSEHAVE